MIMARNVEQFMKRAVYDKQFKIAAVKLAQSENKSMLDTAIGGLMDCTQPRQIN